MIHRVEESIVKTQQLEQALILAQRDEKSVTSSS
jgi:hypothetical protein